jgi:hypothetical protein
VRRITSRPSCIGCAASSRRCRGLSRGSQWVATEPGLRCCSLRAGRETPPDDDRAALEEAPTTSPGQGAAGLGEIALATGSTRARSRGATGRCLERATRAACSRHGRSARGGGPSGRRATREAPTDSARASRSGRARRPVRPARFARGSGRDAAALGDADSAALEFDAALRTFRELGPSPTSVESSGCGSTGEPAGRPVDREAEVLGWSRWPHNRAIASAWVSANDVDRHVSNIFTKLGVRRAPRRRRSRRTRHRLTGAAATAVPIGCRALWVVPRMRAPRIARPSVVTAIGTRRSPPNDDEVVHDSEQRVPDGTRDHRRRAGGPRGRLPSDQARAARSWWSMPTSGSATLAQPLGFAALFSPALSTGCRDGVPSARFTSRRAARWATSSRRTPVAFGFPVLSGTIVERVRDQRRRSFEVDGRRPAHRVADQVIVATGAFRHPGCRGRLLLDPTIRQLPLERVPQPVAAPRRARCSSSVSATRAPTSRSTSQDPSDVCLRARPPRVPDQGHRYEASLLGGSSCGSLATRVFTLGRPIRRRMAPHVRRVARRSLRVRSATCARRRHPVRREDDRGSRRKPMLQDGACSTSRT